MGFFFHFLSNIKIVDLMQIAILKFCNSIYSVLGEGNNPELFGLPFKHTDLHPIRQGQTTDKRMLV